MVNLLMKEEIKIKKTPKAVHISKNPLMFLKVIEVFC